MNLTRPLVVVLLAVLAAAAADAAPLWKWRDANGRIQVSDRPPPKAVPDSAILQRPGATPAVSYTPAAVPPGDAAPIHERAVSAAVDPELEQRRQQIEAQAKAQSKPAAPPPEPRAAAQRADNCQRARNQLAALQSGQRMARATASGEREVLDDKARAEETQRAQAQIQANCK